MGKKDYCHVVILIAIEITRKLLIAEVLAEFV